MYAYVPSSMYLVHMGNVYSSLQVCMYECMQVCMYTCQIHLPVCLHIFFLLPSPPPPLLSLSLCLCLSLSLSLSLSPCPSLYPSLSLFIVLDM